MTPAPSTAAARRAATALIPAFILGGCSPGPLGSAPDPDSPICELDQSLLFTSVPADAIPSLIEPDMVTIGDPGAEYLIDSDRILGVVIDGQPRAYPHNVMWHHEIVSDRVGDRWVTATFCPLTGSGLVYDPHVGTERLDIGVSGLLFANNLVFYDRTSGDVYGPQLSVEGKCSRFVDSSLELLPVQEMSWGQWRVVHPNTTVVSSETGFDRNYRVSPYAGYGELDNDDLLFDMTVDASRPLKERVLAIRVADGGIGYPFGELAELGDAAALNTIVGGVPTAIFYAAADGETAVAFDARLGTQTLTFEAGQDGLWTDLETGTRWRVDGSAQEGPLRGERLSPHPDAYVVYWFAWRHFQPNGTTWAP